MLLAAVLHAVEWWMTTLILKEKKGKKKEYGKNGKVGVSRGVYLSRISDKFLLN